MMHRYIFSPKTEEEERMRKKLSVLSGSTRKEVRGYHYEHAFAFSICIEGEHYIGIAVQTDLFPVRCCPYVSSYSY